MVEYKQIIQEFLLNKMITKERYKVLNIEKKERKYKYLENLNSLLLGKSRTFRLDLKDILENSNNLVNELIYFDAERFVNALDNAVLNCMGYLNSEKFISQKFSKEKVESVNEKKSTLQNEIKKKFQLEIIPDDSFSPKTVKELRADIIGKFVKIKARVKYCGGVKVVSEALRYFCTNCRKVFYDYSSSFHKKTKKFCPNKDCRNNMEPVFLQNCPESETFYFSQMIRVGGEFKDWRKIDNDQDLVVKLKSYQCGQFFLGENLKIFGILKPELKINQGIGESLKLVFLESYYIERTDFVPKPLPLFKLNFPDVFKTYPQDNLEQKIFNSFLPIISDDLNFKKIMIYSILSSNSFSCNSEISFNNGLWTLIESPHNAKLSWFLNYLHKSLRLGSIYFSNYEEVQSEGAIHSNNLFREITKNTKFVSEKNKNRIFLIDGLDKFKKTEIFFKNSRMKWERNFNFKKEIEWPAIIATISSRKINDIFGNSPTKEIYENCAETFDLHLIFDNSLNTTQDKTFARKIIEMYVYNKTTFRDQHLKDENFLSLYFERAKTIQPIFPLELMNLISFYYLSDRLIEPDQLFLLSKIKVVNLLIKLTIACARSKLKTRIDEWDICEALDIFRFFKARQKESPSEKISNRNQESLIRLYNEIRIFGISKNTLTLELIEIENLIKNSGFSMADLTKCLVYYEKMGVWDINIKNGKLIFIP